MAYPKLLGQSLVHHASGYLEKRSNFMERKFYIENGKKIFVETQINPLNYWKTKISKKSSQANRISLNKKMRNEVMQTLFSCDVCNKKFSCNFELTTHQRTHLQENLFACNFCDMKYMQMELLQAHLLTHNAMHHHSKENLDDNNDNSFLKKEPVIQLQRIEETKVKRNVCEICNKKCSNSYNLERHQMIHTGQKPFPCGICHKRFYRKDNLETHRKTHRIKSFGNAGRENFDRENNEIKLARKETQVGTKLFNCNICNTMHGSKSNLIRHKIIHARKKSFSCNVCNRKFLREHSLRVHQFSHKKKLIKKASQKVLAGECHVFNKKTCTFDKVKTEDADSQFSCNICIKSFQNNSQLMRHARMHSGERPFSCGICKKTFSRKDNLKTHEQIHRRQLYSQNKKFKSKNTRELPISSLNEVKIITKLFICRFCDKKFQSNSELIAHQKTHNSSEMSSVIQIVHQKPYECTKCDYTFSQRELLENHSKNCKGKDVQYCDICSKGFSTTADLLCHLERHAGRLPFTCGLCGKSFAYKHKFAKHCKTHEKGKYICNKCGEEFTYAAQLLIHVKMHASKKRFPCVICHKKFGSVLHLNKHLVSHRIMSSDETSEITGDMYTDHTYAVEEISQSDQIEKESCNDQPETLKDECHSSQTQMVEKEPSCSTEDCTKLEMKENKM